MRELIKNLPVAFFFSAAFFWVFIPLSGEEGEASKKKPVGVFEQCDNEPSNAGMKMCAEKVYRQSNEELNILFKKRLPEILETTDDAAYNRELLETFKASQKSWVSYRDNFCVYLSDLHKGGSIRTYVFYSCMADLTQKRIDEIENYLYDHYIGPRKYKRQGEKKNEQGCTE